MILNCKSLSLSCERTAAIASEDIPRASCAITSVALLSLKIVTHSFKYAVLWSINYVIPSVNPRNRTKVLAQIVRPHFSIKLHSWYKL
jgi:hypothetical protein